jgi:hypothetical protein
VPRGPSMDSTSHFPNKKNIKNNTPRARPKGRTPKCWRDYFVTFVTRSSILTLLPITFQMIISGSFFLLVSWGGVRLSPLGTSATNWPIVPATDDI